MREESSECKSRVAGSDILSKEQQCSGGSNNNCSWKSGFRGNAKPSVDRLRVPARIPSSHFDDVLAERRKTYCPVRSSSVISVGDDVSLFVELLAMMELTTVRVSYRRTSTRGIA